MLLVGELTRFYNRSRRKVHGGVLGRESRHDVVDDSDRIGGVAVRLAAIAREVALGAAELRAGLPPKQRRPELICKCDRTLEFGGRGLCVTLRPEDTAERYTS